MIQMAQNDNHMTTPELVLNMLAEASTTEISKQKGSRHTTRVVCREPFCLDISVVEASASMFNTNSGVVM